MRLLAILRLRLRSLLLRKKVEAELDEELRYHLERDSDAATAGIEQRKEECRDARGVSLLDNAMQDSRYAIRQLRKNPGFAATTIFVLALGVAAAVAIFGFVEAALIKPLPYPDQSSLVAVFASSPGHARSIVSYSDLLDWKSFNKVFRSIDGYALNGGFTLSTAHGAELVTGTRVSAGFFHTLGVTPALGRDFRSDEDSPATPRAVILSYDAWQKRFGAKQDVLGQTVTLNGAPNTIVGVLPRDFHFALQGAADFWGLLRSSDACEQSRSCHNLITIARLKDGVSIATASADVQAIVHQLRSQYPDSNRDFGGANLVPLRELIVGDIRPLLLALLTGAALLLLIACLNVTTLLLARSDTRQHEIAVRGSLGASSLRLIHQFATEGLVLAVVSGALGLLFAQWGMRLLAGLIPAERIEKMPFLYGLELNPFTILLGCSISLLAAVLCSVLPLARTALPHMAAALKEGARGYAGTTWRRFGSNLVVVEVAIAMVLMVSAGLLGKSLYVLLHLDTGFEPEHLMVAATSWPPANYSTSQQKINLKRQILDRISALPGVKSAAVSLTSPVGPVWGTTYILGLPNHSENEVLHRQVSSGYFTTLGARLFRGRYFRENEDTSKPLVAIVNRTFAEKYFRGGDPIGKPIYYDWQPQSPIEIVGVVDDIKEGPLEGAAAPVLYVPFDQKPVAWFAILIRTSQAGSSLFTNIVTAIHSIDSFISVSGGTTMIDRINQSPSAYLHRSAAWLVGAFASAAFLLSVVGLYGVVAYSVSQRTREIGVRMALGAERATVYKLILKEAGRLTLLGVVLGLVCALAAATLLRSLLFGVRAWDLSTWIVAAGCLAAASLVASYFPARRAASVNPVEALRAE